MPGGAFTVLEKMIRETFLPRLLLVNMKTLSPIVGTLSTIPIKVAGLVLLNPVMSAKDKYLSYQQGSVELVRAGPGGGGHYPMPTT